MQKIVLIIGVVLCGLGVWAWDRSQAPRSVAETLTFQDTAFDSDVCFEAFGESSQVCLSAQQGRYVLINFWASWCAPCVKELPLIFEFAKAYDDEVSVILLSGDRRARDAISFLDERFGGQEGNLQHISANIHVGFDQNSQIAKTRFQSFRYPETFILTQDQSSMAKLIGELSVAQMRMVEREIETPE